MPRKAKHPVERVGKKTCTVSEIEKLKAELVAKEKQIRDLQAEKNRALQIKTSEKGCVSVYGLNARFPVSLYPDQWEKLASFMPAVQTYIKTNKVNLTKLGEASKLLKQATKLQAVG